MKKLKIILSSLIIVLSIFMLTGCGTANVDYDLVAGGNSMTYTTVENMKGTPRNYINKTFKIRGKLMSNGNTYHYMTGYDASNCCTWSLEVRAGSDVKYPSSSKNVVATGTYKSVKVNGRTSYYLEVTEFE